MPARSSRLPKDLAAARRRIDTWRAGNTKRRRIPESMWEAAVRLAKVHSVNSVSEAMRLSHERLAERLKTQGSKAKRGARVPRFVQVSPIEMASTPNKVSIDLVDASGRSMTLRGAENRDVIELVAAFFGGSSV